jgi:hypothetical protein
MNNLVFEELEVQEELDWGVVIAAGAGVLCGIVVYVAIAT